MIVAAFLADVAVVVIFVVIGRETHQEARFLTDIARTAAPFVIALGGGWALLRAHRQPLATSVGVALTVITVGGGMVLRRTVFDEGTALAFVLVTSGFLALGIIGWRLVARTILRRRSEAVG